MRACLGCQIWRFYRDWICLALIAKPASLLAEIHFLLLLRLLAICSKNGKQYQIAVSDLVCYGILHQAQK
jgi:hypothetical protein